MSRDDPRPRPFFVNIDPFKNPHKPEIPLSIILLRRLNWLPAEKCCLLLSLPLRNQFHPKNQPHEPDGANNSESNKSISHMIKSDHHNSKWPDNNDPTSKTSRYLPP